MSASGSVAGILLAAALALGGPVVFANPRTVEFPAPELAVTLPSVALGLVRPGLELPGPPPVPAPSAELGGAPFPRFVTAVGKPLPVVRDPGGFSCIFVAFRRAVTLAECGVHRMYLGDVRGARDALEESVGIDPRGSQAPAAYVWLGEAAFLEGRAEPAERAYRTALPLNPPPELALHAELGLGWLALRRGDVAEAQRALTQAARYTPTQPLALVIRYLQGVAQLFAGRPADALATWDSVAASGAPVQMLDELPFWRGVARARLGDADRAVQELDAFAASASAHPLRLDALVQAGWVELERNRLAEAERRFLDAEARGARLDLRPQLRAGLVRIYLALGDVGRATDVARRLVADAPRDSLVGSALLLIAEAAAERGAHGEAVEVYRQLVNLPLAPPVRDYARYRLGESLEEDGRRAAAMPHYRTLRDTGKEEGIAQRATYRLGLIALRDRDPVAARREGESLLRVGTLPALRELALLLAAEGAARANDPNRAVALFRQALREAPGSARVGQIRLALGWALLADGEPESALREWTDVARMADLETARFAALAIADVALRQGHEAQALAALRQLRTTGAALPVPPESIALSHGILAVRAGADAEAVALLEPIVPRLGDFPRQALARRALGVARYRLRQYDLAEREFRASATLQPIELSAWLGVGLAALVQNRLAEAEDALRRVAAGTSGEIASNASYGLVLVAARRGDAIGFRERTIGFVDRYPANPLAGLVLYGLATATLESGDLGQGEGWVRRLAREHPDSEYVDDALMRLAQAADSRPALARQAYRDLLARRLPAETRATAAFGLAETALKLQDGAGAQQAAEEFLREAPAGDLRIVRAYALLVRALELQGRRDQALRATETFLARFPNDAQTPAFQLTRGQLLVAERRWDAAQKAFEAARDRGDAAVAAPAQYWLGEALRAQDQHEAAVASYLGATYLYPSTPWAARGLQGAAESYLARKMGREAGIVLRKLAAIPGADPAVAQWARQVLAQLGPAAAEDGRRLLPRPDPGKP